MKYSKRILKTAGLLNEAAGKPVTMQFLEKINSLDAVQGKKFVFVINTPIQAYIAYDPKDKYGSREDKYWKYSGKYGDKILVKLDKFKKLSGEYTRGPVYIEDKSPVGPVIGLEPKGKSLGSSSWVYYVKLSDLISNATWYPAGKTSEDFSDSELIAAIKKNEPKIAKFFLGLSKDFKNRARIDDSFDDMMSTVFGDGDLRDALDNAVGDNDKVSAVMNGIVEKAIEKTGNAAFIKAMEL